MPDNFRDWAGDVVDFVAGLLPKANDDHCRAEGSTLTGVTKFKREYLAWMVAFVFAALAVALSLRLIAAHLRNYTNAAHQKHICRILLLVPLFATDAFLSLVFSQYSVYLDVVRDCYEAFVLYDFFALLVEYLGGSNAALELFATKAPMRLLPPMCCVWTFEKPINKFLRRCKQATLQYVIVRPACTVAAVVLQAIGRYCLGNLHPVHGYVWLAAVVTVSVSISLYALVLFYEATKDDLAQHKPLLKFLSIKFVIFLTFWQSIVIAILVRFNIIRGTEYWSQDNVASAIQNLLITFEMLLAAIFHMRAFSWHPYAAGDSPTPIPQSMLRVLNPWDLAVESFTAFAPPPGMSRRHAERADSILKSSFVVDGSDNDDSATSDAEDGSGRSSFGGGGVGDGAAHRRHPHHPLISGSLVTLPETNATATAAAAAAGQPSSVQSPLPPPLPAAEPAAPAAAAAFKSAAYLRPQQTSALQASASVPASPALHSTQSPSLPSIAASAGGGGIGGGTALLPSASAAPSSSPARAAHHHHHHAPAELSFADLESLDEGRPAAILQSMSAGGSGRWQGAGSGDELHGR